MQFFDQYRSYVINYNLGKDLVRNYVERRAQGNAETALAGVRGAALVAAIAVRVTLNHLQREGIRKR